MTKERVNEIVSEVADGLAPRMKENEFSDISWIRTSICGVFEEKIVFRIWNKS